MANDARNELLDFMDRKAFDPVLRARAENFTEADHAILREVQLKTESEKEKFHKDYKSAGEVKRNYLDNVRSPSAEKINSDLKQLGLPTLPSLKDDFMELCDRLEV